MRNFLFFGALSVMINVNAQSPHANLSLATGLMKNITTDDILGPYLFKGNNALFKLTASKQKRLFEHNLEIYFSSLAAKSSVQNTVSVPSQFYFLQYAFQYQIISQNKTLMWLGPGLSTRASLRNPTDNNIAGELIGSLELCMKTLRLISKAGKIEANLNLPITNYLVHRKYALSPDIDNKLVSWAQLQSFQFQFVYLLQLKRNVDFILGYDLSYYAYDFNESVTLLNQQYYGGIRINFKGNEDAER